MTFRGYGRQWKTPLCVAQFVCEVCRCTGHVLWVEKGGCSNLLIGSAFGCDYIINEKS